MAVTIDVRGPSRRRVGGTGGAGRGRPSGRRVRRRSGGWGALPFVVGGAVGLGLVAVAVQWPEIQRYMKMRSM